MLARLGARLDGWPRRLAVVVCLVLAAASAVSEASQRKTATAAVVVTGHAVASGEVFAATDLRLEHWPRSARPPNALAGIAAVAGHRAAGPLAAGEVVTATRLVSTALTSGLGPGFVAVGVPLADPAAVTLVHPGDSVDLVLPPGPDTQQASIIVRRVAVIAVMAAAANVVNDQPAELVVAVGEADELQLAAVAGRGLFAPVHAAP